MSDKILFSYDGYQLLDNGELNKYTGSYHDNDYYDTIGNIKTDNKALEKLIQLAVESGKHQIQRQIKEVLGIKA